MKIYPTSLTRTQKIYFYLGTTVAFLILSLLTQKIIGDVGNLIVLGIAIAYALGIHKVAIKKSKN